MDMIELNGISYESADALKTRLHIAEMTLNRYMKKGLPRPIRVGGRRFFERDVVDRWLAQKWK